MQILGMPQVRMLVQGLYSGALVKKRIDIALSPIITTKNSEVALRTKTKKYSIDPNMEPLWIPEYLEHSKNVEELEEIITRLKVIRELEWEEDPYWNEDGTAKN